jgi:hypothetical protein
MREPGCCSQRSRNGRRRSPSAIALDATGNANVADGFNGRSGNVVLSWGELGRGEEQFR